MKNNIISLILILVLFTSCEKWIDSDINKSKDDPTDVDIAVILPSIEGSLAYYYGGIDLAGTVSVWMQQITGSDRQFVAINNYTLRPGDINNLWSSLYEGTMMDLKTLIDKINESDAPEQNTLGVAKVLFAVTLASATDVWGDIPYSQAFLGNKNTTPTYDSQESIYQEVNKLLNEAINDLQSTNNTKGIPKDFIYGSDAQKWIKAAYSLKARYEMRLSKVKNIDYTSIIANLDKGISSVEENMEEPFDKNSTKGYNPIYQFISQRSGYISPNSYYDNMLSEVIDSIIVENDTVRIHDPRNGIQTLGNGFWTSRGSSVKFIGAAECMFIKAEAYYRMGNFADAKDALKSAYDLSIEEYKEFLRLNVYVGYKHIQLLFDKYKEYLYNSIDSSLGTNLLEMIMVEKYKHLFLSPETYNDYRRTGYPKLKPTQGDKLPRRYPYASSEIQYNPNNTPDANIFQRVWWDK